MGGAKDEIEELQVHINLGNYYYITDENIGPHIVANFFKKVLNCMSEPLCTYRLYYKFREVGESMKDNKV
jgi:hypothetical protein